MISSTVESYLKEVLGDTYDYAISVVAYSESKSLDYNYIGMAEFRDALTHVKRAIIVEDDETALLELNSASEHIRRAAVESIQDYVESKFKKVRDRAYTPLPIYYLILHKNPDMKLIKEKEDVIKNCIYKGREAKPGKRWIEAVAYFQEAEKELEDLEKMLPTVRQAKFASSEILLLIASILFGVFLTIIFAIILSGRL